MQPRLMKTELATFEAREWTGENRSGWAPVGDQVMVLPDVAAAKIGSVYIPDQQVDRQSLASETGILVAIGDGAFVWNADRTRPWAGTKPVPGQRVCFGRYSGQLVKGADGLSYRMMSDSCIGGVEATPDFDAAVAFGEEAAAEFDPEAVDALR